MCLFRRIWFIPMHPWRNDGAGAGGRKRLAKWVLHEYVVPTNVVNFAHVV